MKRTFAAAIPALLFLSAFGLAPSAFATIPPTLSLLATGSGDNVQINITGDPNVSVLLSYTETGAGPMITSLGSTDGNGSFSTVISSASYGITSGTAVTAILNGTNGPKSPTMAWPTVTAANAMTLTPNAVVVTAGSSATITAANSGSSALYVSNNSNPSIANVSVSGSQITISGNTAGATTVSICQIGSNSNCPTIYVTVEQAGSSQLSFSQNNPSIVSGQNLPITISGGNGVYEIVNNTNASTIQASISGTVLTLSTGVSTGSSSLTLCSSDMTTCGVILATAGSASSVAVSFSSSAPVVSTSQSTTINIYGPSGVQFYVSSNSNPSIVQANLSGTALTLTGIAPGSSTISVCASTGTCASLTATVEYVATGGNIALSQNTLSLQTGQNVIVTVSGGEPPYTVSGGTSSVSQETLNGSALTVYGIGAGSSSVNVCSAGGGCILLVVSVNGAGSTASSGAFSVNPTAVSMTVGQGTSVALSGTGSYSLSTNTGPSVAAVSVNGSIAVIAGLSVGSTNATLCETGGACLTLPITVNQAASAPVAVITPIVSTPAPSAPAYTFTQYLEPGSENADVMALQQLLAAEGYLTATPTGYFGDQTENAVLAFQAAKGIDQLGVVGPSTRAALNQIESAASASGSTSDASISTMTLSQLQAEVQLLQSELTQALSRISQLTGQ